MSYANSTSVDASKSQAEIQSTLIRFGADGFMSGSQRRPDGNEVAMIMFQYHGKSIRFVMELPRRDEKRFQSSPAGRVRYDVNQRHTAWEQACKSKWRALFIAVKAKLVAVEEGISTVEQEFMAWVVLPNGRTAGEHLLPQIEEAATTGQMPLLPWSGKEVE